MKTTNINTTGLGIELDIAPSDTWTAQWQFTSITDQDDLRRLRNVYALIVSTDAQYDALEAYFRSRRPASSGAAHSAESRAVAPPAGRADAAFRGLFEGLLPAETMRSPPPSSKPASDQTAPAPQVGGPPSGSGDQNARSKTQQAIPWPQAKQFIVEGDSIDCRLFQSAQPPRGHGVPFRRWLFWRKPGGLWLPETAGLGIPQSLGNYGGWEIGVTSRACFDDFVILVQGFTPATNSVSNQGPKLMLQ
jgi:hypothetical protein